MTFLRSIISITLFVGLIAGLPNCGGGGGGTTYNYDVTSATYFTEGVQVAVVRFGISESCSNFTGVTSDITRVGAGTVSTQGSVSFSFTTGITPPMVEGVYIDNSASGTLDYGDRVWGYDAFDLGGFCFDAYDTDQTFDWDSIAAVYGSTTYQGGEQAYRSELGSESELMINNVFIVDVDGYNSINLDGDGYDRMQRNSNSWVGSPSSPPSATSSVKRPPIPRRLP